MKRLEDIERMSMEQLEAIASDDSVKAPASLEAKVDSALVASVVNRGHSGGSWPMSSSFVAVLSLAAACMAILFAVNRQPKDTFDDPYEAYATIEKTFVYISEKMDAGFEIAGEAGQTIEKTTEILKIDREK